MEKYCSKCKNKFDQSFNYCPFCGNKRIKNIKSNKLPDYNKQEQLARENESPEFLEQIKKLKNVSLILGIFSIFGGGFFVAIFGLTFGILYRKKTKDFCIGIWINIFVIIIDIVVLLGLFLSNFNGDNIDNNLNEFITIGDQYTGYITLSDEWKKINHDNPNRISYYYDDMEINGHYTISLSYFHDNEIVLHEYLETVKQQLFDSDILISEIKEVLVSNKNAYQIDGYDTINNNYISIWIFKDSMNYIRYITIEGSNQNDEVFDLINNYSYQY